MTEKEFKKMQHFLKNRKPDSELAETVGHIEKIEQKQGIEAAQWKVFVDIMCQQNDLALLAWVLDNRKAFLAVDENAVSWAEQVMDSWRTKLADVKTQTKMLDKICTAADKKCLPDILGTALVIACENNNIYAAWHLLEQGADIGYMVHGKTSMQMAQKYAESAQGAGDDTLYQYLSDYAVKGKSPRDVQQFYSGRDYFGAFVYQPQKVDKEAAAQGRVRFLLEEYEREGLLEENTTAEALDMFMEEYNWDDGLELPYFIAQHKNCELATALKIFYLAEGTQYFKEGFADTTNHEWKHFLEMLYTRIAGGVYRKGTLRYEVPLTAAQKSSIQKAGADAVFLNDV